MFDKEKSVEMHEHLKTLANTLHELDCHDPDCSWGFENWIFNSDNIFLAENHSHNGSGTSAKQIYYNKADKIYQCFNHNLQTCKKCIDLIYLTNPVAAKAFISSL